MSGNATFKQIPIVVQTAGRENLGRLRLAARIGALALLILIPLSGLFRIDLSAGFVVLDRQIWFSDFFIVFGFWLTAACLLIILYSTMGTVFCGWVCPQNSFSSWANRITARALGKRAIINWGDDQKAAGLASGKNVWHSWVLLFLKLLGASLLLALLPMLYFLPPDAIWAFVTFQDDPRVQGSLYWIFAVFTVLALANIAIMRHYVCRYMCIYRMWQYLFKTRDTLHIEYDAARNEKCDKCNFCVTACPVGIDPRNTLTFDSCTNCGECITACDSLYEKQGKPGLLRFRFGLRQGKLATNNRMDLSSLTARVTWVLPVLALAVGLLTWGVMNYQPYHLSVYRAEIAHGDKVRDYRINISNKLYHSAEVSVSVVGLPEGAYSLDAPSVSFDTATRKDILLTIADELPSGLHAVTVTAKSADGWQQSFQFQHFVEKG